MRSLASSDWINHLSLLLMPQLMQLRIPLTFFAAAAYCSLILSLSTRSLFAELLPIQSVLNSCITVSQVQNLAFVLTSFLFVCSSSLLNSFCRVSLSSEVSIHFPTQFGVFSKLHHLIPLLKSFMNMLNKMGSNIFCWGTPHVKGFWLEKGLFIALLSECGL